MKIPCTPDLSVFYEIDRFIARDFLPVDIILIAEKIAESAVNACVLPGIYDLLAVARAPAQIKIAIIIAQPQTPEHAAVITQFSAVSA